jgi:hypothetical protein
LDTPGSEFSKGTMNYRKHPEPAELLAFVRCEVSRAAGRAIVRHLLKGCPACSAAIRYQLELGETSRSKPCNPVRKGMAESA